MTAFIYIVIVFFVMNPGNLDYYFVILTRILGPFGPFEILAPAGGCLLRSLLKKCGNTDTHTPGLFILDEVRDDNSREPHELAHEEPC